MTVSLDGPYIPFDRRLLGTNLPARVGSERLADPGFRQRVVDVGTTVVRMPGGSWSNSYDWAGCENGDMSRCAWSWAAKPSDFIGFLAATGIEGMWTVDVNHTAQEAAALVAFFNGSTDDLRSIGRDRNGQDWGTVARWARLRADHGHPAPQHISLWEVGNEVYGSKSDTDPECADFG